LVKPIIVPTAAAKTAIMPKKKPSKEYTMAMNSEQNVRR
jgi:hypothetical protein